MTGKTLASRYEDKVGHDMHILIGVPMIELDLKQILA